MTSVDRQPGIAATLQDPQIIRLADDPDRTWWQFAPDQDVLILGGGVTRTAEKLAVEGGRNIVLYGGEFHPRAGDGSVPATVAFRNFTGSVHIAKTHIDNQDAGERDAIVVSGAEGAHPKVTLSDVLVDNVQGSVAGQHGDVFQILGQVGDVVITGLTASTHYQGVFASPQQPIGSLTLRNLDVTGLGDGRQQTYLLWFLDGAGQRPYPITLDHVFAAPAGAGAAEEYGVWPKASLGDGIGAVRDGGAIHWPGLPISGDVSVGAPPGGHFVAADAVGMHAPPLTMDLYLQ